MEIEIRGKYEETVGFILVYADDALYTISKDEPTTNWARIKVGDRGSYGGMLTKELYEKWRSECTKEGVFKLQSS